MRAESKTGQGADLTGKSGLAEGISRDNHTTDWPEKQGLDAEALANGAIVEREPSLGWQVYTLADAYTERPPYTYAVEGVLAHGTLNICYGPPGSLKSFLMADMCACVAGGMPWLAPLPKLPGSGFKTTASPVLWIDFDNGTRRTHDRFEALGRSRDLSPETPLYYVSMPQPWLAMSDAAQTDQLAELILHYGARLTVVDNLSLVCGESDENSAEMGRVMGNFRRLTELTQTAMTIVHHQRKSSGIGGRRGDTLRGHSSIEAALDLALLVEREDGADSVTVRSTKVRGPDVDPFGALFTYEHKEDTTELYGARFYGIKLAEKTTQKDLSNAILQAVGDEPGINQTTLIKMVSSELSGFGQNRIHGEIHHMVSKGLLLQSDGKFNAKCYHVA